MVKYYIYGAVILFFLWKGRFYIKGLFQHVKRTKTTEPAGFLKEDDVTFVPVETKKTYVFAIELEEMGDGKAKLSIIKPIKLNENN